MQDDSALRQAVQAAATASNEAAAQLAAEHEVQVSPEMLWRHRGSLVSGGVPIWRDAPSKRYRYAADHLRQC
jgi:hypothetical protein